MDQVFVKKLGLIFILIFWNWFSCIVKIIEATNPWSVKHKLIMTVII